MNEITKELHRIVDENGPVTFKKFMELALYHPKYGYYTKGRFPGGISGDFVTSPHTNELFGALMARQLIQMKEILGTKKFTIIEMGAGAGYMALDILNFLRKMGKSEEFNYVIIEPFDNNVLLQKHILRDFIELVEWRSDTAGISDMEGCFLSNELLDAFPVHLIEKDKGVWKEVFLVPGEKGFDEVLMQPSSVDVEDYCKKWLNDLPDGYRTEINLEIKAWIFDLSRVIKRGFVITVDYGHTRNEYFHPSRNRGTLLSYFRQQVSEDIYSDPGNRDITAHVNFSDVDYWGKEALFDTVGYSSQCFFLAGQDVEKVIEILEGKKRDPFSPRNAALKSLLLPQGMGESHKVLIQSKGVETDVQLNGFKFTNKKSRL